MTRTELIYLDHAATSPLRREARSAMEAALGRADFNPASGHAAGRIALDALEEARATLGRQLEADPARIVFTGGGTLADNLAILGFARHHRGREPRLLVGAVEHKAVLGAARRAGREGAEVVVLPVDSAGRVRLDVLEARLQEGEGRPTLVSLMWANNETGVVQPVTVACELAHRHGARFHTDAVQAVGKLPVSVRAVPADLLSATAHKLGGPVGIGLLYVNAEVELEPLAFGGTQERGLWPGTQNPVAAAGFAAAVRAAESERPAAAERWRRLRDGLAAELRRAVPDLVVHGESADRLPGILSVGVPGADTGTLLLALDLAGVAVSSGSACDSGSEAGSHVLAAMGAGAEGPYGVLRFSFGPGTSEEDVRRARDATVAALGTAGVA